MPGALIINLLALFDVIW